MNKQEWFDYFAGINREYIPLIVNVQNPSAVKYTAEEIINDPQKAIDAAVDKFALTKQVGSDCVLMAESNFLENLVPCMFGAKTHFSPGGLIDIYPFISDIYETENIKADSIFCFETEKAVKHLEYMRDNAPDDMYVTTSRFMSPLDYAVVMMGGDFYMEMLAEPELSVNFMEKISEVTIKAIKFFKEIIKQPIAEAVTPRSIYYPGLRLTGDAVVNLSPGMIADIMCPLYKRFEAEFERVMLHYCCTPAPSQHVIGALGKGGGVHCMDNWQGYETIFNGNMLQTEVGVCTDVSKDEILNGVIFENPLLKIKERPLVIGTMADTVEEGKKIYDLWRNMQEIKRGSE